MDNITAIWEEFLPYAEKCWQLQRKSESSGNCHDWWKSRFYDFFVGHGVNNRRDLEKCSRFPEIWEQYGDLLQGGRWIASQDHSGINRGREEEEPQVSNIVFAETRLRIENIIVNPNNPRKHFDEDKLQELAQSIQEVGILQPLVVTDSDEEGKYLLIAGERRLRAAKMAGLEKVPAVYRYHVRPGQSEDEENEPGADEGYLQAYMLIENLQREDLDPIEEAKAFRILTQDHGWKQTDLAVK